MPGVDPLGSLRAWPLTIELGGREYTTRPVLADEWLTILLEDPLDLAEILPGMLEEADEVALEEALFEGAVSDKEIRDATLEIVALSAGRDWWWVMNLIGAAASAWTVVYGRLVTLGVNPAVMPLGAFLDAMYLSCAQVMDKEQRAQFDRDLEHPPASVTAEEAIDEDAESASFLAMLNASA